MFTSAPALEVFSIPELMDAIQVYLTPYDLAQCATVSKAFNDLIVPILWETITIKTYHQHISFTAVLEVQQALARYAHHIQVIHLRSCKSRWPFLLVVDPTQLKRLHTLAFPFTVDTEHSFPKPSSTLEALVRTADEHVLAAPSLVYSSPQAENSQGRMMTFTGFDKVAAQKDWLQAKGMFVTQEEVSQFQLGDILRLQRERQRQRQIEKRERAQQLRALRAQQQHQQQQWQQVIDQQHPQSATTQSQHQRALGLQEQRMHVLFSQLNQQQRTLAQRFLQPHQNQRQIQTIQRLLQQTQQRIHQAQQTYTTLMTLALQHHAQQAQQPHATPQAQPVTVSIPQIVLATQQQMQQATTARQQELVTHWMMRQLDQEELFREEFLQSPDQRSVSIQQNRTELHRHEQLADEQRLLQEQRQRQSQRQQHLTPAL
ncbi:hypothetical protein BGX33_011774 [Mortierella sp. NVP41]|nr:hypothetical protein BGX33_011774 [Mortierella sp. NVP41]